MIPLRKSLSALAAGVALTGGSIGIAAVSPLGLAGAQEEPVPTQEESQDSTATDEQARPEKGERVRTALQPLIDDGTLTEAQADAVVDQLATARGEREGERGHRGHRGRLANFEIIEEVTGLSAEELRAAFAEGQTLAELAGDNVEELRAAMVEAAETRIEAALASGRIDAAQAEEMKAGLAERVDERLNTTPGEGRNGG